MKAFLTDIHQLRGVEWARSYLWDVRFLDAPAPFNSWFPATDFSLGESIGISGDIPAGNTSIKFPQATASPDLTLTTLDNDERVLHEWMTEWYDKVWKNPKGILTLREAVRECHIATLRSDKSVLKLRKLLVYPDASMSLTGGSASDIVTMPLSFVVAGQG